METGIVFGIVVDFEKTMIVVDFEMDEHTVNFD